MNKEIFIKWTDDGVGGIFKIEFTDFVHMIKYEPVSGSMVPFGELMGFLWNSNLLDEIRESTTRTQAVHETISFPVINLTSVRLITFAHKE